MTAEAVETQDLTKQDPNPVEGGAKWLDIFPEEARKDFHITKYKTPDELYKGHKNLVELATRKGVAMPDEKASPEEWGKFYNTLGRPEKPEAYKMEPPSDLHPSIQVTPEAQQAFFAAAHKAGLSNRAANAMHSWYLQEASRRMFEMEKSSRENQEKTMLSLRNEWGKDYDRNLQLANRFVSRVGGEEAVDAFGDLGDNPVVLRTLAKAALMMSEDSVNRLGFSALETTPQDAKRQIKDILDDKKGPYWDESHPRHKELVKEVTELYKIAYPKNEG